MSFCVNAALQRTRCSNTSSGRRRCLRHCSLLTLRGITSSSSSRLDRVVNVPSITTRGTPACLRNHSSGPQSLILYNSWTIDNTSKIALLHCRGHAFGTSARHSKPFNSNIGTEVVKEASGIPSATFAPTSAQKASISTSADEASSSPSPFSDGMSHAKGVSATPSMSRRRSERSALPGSPHEQERWVNHFFIDESVGEEEASTGPPEVTVPRRLPYDFEIYLSKLAALISQKCDQERLRDTFKYSINEMEGRTAEHGALLIHWLKGPWDQSKATAVMHLLLGSIVTSLELVLRILEHLDTVQRDFLVRSRCLSFAARIHREILSKDSVLLAKFDEQVDDLRRPAQWPPLNMDRQQLSLLLWRLDTNYAKKLIDLVLVRYPSLSVPARIFLATYCARHRLPLLGSAILVGLPAGMLQSPGPAILRCCALLLRHDTVSDGPNGTNFVILSQLLERGLTPDNMLYARIIERALGSGYPNVAWDIFHHIRTIDVNITGWTYVLLLRDAFNRNNIAGVEEIMNLVQSDISLFTNLHLLLYSMNMVRRIFYNEKKLTTAESFSHILALYDRVFSREPLIKLGVLPRLGSSTTTTLATAPAGYVRDLVQPDSYSLSFTVWTYVLCHRNGRHAAPLWRRIQDLAKAGDPHVVNMMKHDLVYNAFMWINLRSKSRIVTAIGILQSMMEMQYCVPTQRTWSIMICGLLRHNQYAQARQIYGLMKQYSLGMKDIRQEYWRRKWSFEYFENHLEEILDENMMPDGTETGKVAAMSDPALDDKILDALVIDGQDPAADENELPAAA